MKADRISNYDLARDQAQTLFLTYDIAPMVSKYGFAQDASFTYLSFLGAEYRINKQTGCVERLENQSAVQAGFNESMTIYDILCYARPDAALSGEFCSVMLLEGVAKSANPGGHMFQKYAQLFSGQQEKLRKACQALGGIPYSVGEVAYQFPLFDFLPVILQFWDADDEFDAQLVLKWDKNTLHYMHFETTFYAAGHLLQRIADLLGKE